MRTIRRRHFVDIEIDKLLNSIENALSGDIFNTEVIELTAKDFRLLRRGWLFDWISEFKTPDQEVYKLVIEGNPSDIQGLVSISDRGDHIFVNLAESASFNRGRDKVYKGVAGNLFAFACHRSFEKGYEGLTLHKQFECRPYRWSANDYF